jgi:hypothetical protein
MKGFFSVVLVIMALGLFIGTVGGIHDNIQFKDWFSVTMWAIFGPAGFALFLAGAGHLVSSSDNSFEYPSAETTLASRLRRIFGWAAVIWLAVLALGLLVGTIGGIHDNIQFRDWFSVTMWAVCGPSGLVLSGVGAVFLISRLTNSDSAPVRTFPQRRY